MAILSQSFFFLPLPSRQAVTWISEIFVVSASVRCGAATGPSAAAEPATGGAAIAATADALGAVASTDSSFGGLGTSRTPASHGHAIPMTNPAAAMTPTRPSSGLSCSGRGTSTLRLPRRDIEGATGLLSRPAGDGKYLPPLPPPLSRRRRERERIRHGDDAILRRRKRQRRIRSQHAGHDARIRQVASTGLHRAHGAVARNDE